MQEIDSVEYGLTDIQEYYGNTGGLKLAAEKQSGRKVTANFIESFSKDTTPRKLEDLLRLEYRTKLLNPKWAEAMINQGSEGAYEISQRMTEVAPRDWTKVAGSKALKLMDSLTKNVLSSQIQTLTVDLPDWRTQVGKSLTRQGLPKKKKSE